MSPSRRSPAAQVNMRLVGRTIDRLDAVRKGEDFATLSEAARAMVLRGLAVAEGGEDAAWSAGFEAGRAEGVRIVMRATQAVMAKAAGDFALFGAAVEQAVEELTRRTEKQRGET